MLKVKSLKEIMKTYKNLLTKLLNFFGSLWTKVFIVKKNLQNKTLP